jgi:hypothetical protein
MTLMCVSLFELLRQMAMGWVTTLEYTLLGVCGLLRPRPIVPGAQGHRFLRPWGW